MNIQKIITIQLLMFSSFAFGMDNFRQDISVATHHFKQGFKTGLNASLYVHGYKTVANKVQLLQSDKAFATFIIAQYLYNHAVYNAHHQNDHNPIDTALSYITGYTFGLGLGFFGIELLINFLN